MLISKLLAGFPAGSCGTGWGLVSSTGIIYSRGDGGEKRHLSWHGFPTRVLAVRTRVGNLCHKADKGSMALSLAIANIVRAAPSGTVELVVDAQHYHRVVRQG